MFKRIFFIAKKEFIQLFRDKRTFRLLLFAPVIQLIIFGYVATTDVKKSPTLICDYDRSPISREFIGRFVSSGYFEILDYVENENDIDDYIDSGRATVAIIIPSDFAENIKQNGNTSVGIHIDGTNSNLATILSGYLTVITSQYSKELKVNYFKSNGLPMPDFPQSQHRIWFNPELKSVNFMVPGVIAMLTLILLLNLTTLGIVRERESGTAEQIAVTPIKPLELIIGKIIPPFFMGYIIITLVLVVGLLWFGIDFAGSVFLLYFFAMFFIIAVLAAGLIISTFAQTADQAMWINIVFTFPNILLSGFIFPIKNMPVAIQAITYLLPMRYFLQIIRGIFMRGAGISQHWDEALILFLWGTTILLIAGWRLKKRLV